MTTPTDPQGGNPQLDASGELAPVRSGTRGRCGRCQAELAWDPALAFQTDWALCPRCTEILLPRR